MPIRPSDPFFWRHYEGPIILVCVRWYLRLPRSYRQVADLMTERGLRVHASCIWRWGQGFGPELDKRPRPHLAQTEQIFPFRRNLYEGQRPRPEEAVEGCQPCIPHRAIQNAQLV